MLVFSNYSHHYLRLQQHIEFVWFAMKKYCDKFSGGFHMVELRESKKRGELNFEVAKREKILEKDLVKKEKN